MNTIIALVVFLASANVILYQQSFKLAIKKAGLSFYSELVESIGAKEPRQSKADCCFVGTNRRPIESVKY